MQWLEQCREWVTKYDPVRPEHMKGLHHYGFVRLLSLMLPDDAIVVSDTGGNAIMTGHCFRSQSGQRIFSSHANSPMGFSMCGAMGAWFAEQDRPVFCLIGDGGAQLNIQELQTIKNYNVNIKIFVLNNLTLGNTRAWQIQNDRRQLACGPDGYSSPDFADVATAYGIDAYNFEDGDNLAGLVRWRGPILIDVRNNYFCDYQPRMTLWNAGIEEMFPLLSEEEFISNMTVPPLAGWQDRRKQYKETK